MTFPKHSPTATTATTTTIGQRGFLLRRLAIKLTGQNVPELAGLGSNGNNFVQKMTDSDPSNFSSHRTGLLKHPNPERRTPLRKELATGFEKVRNVHCPPQLVQIRMSDGMIRNGSKEGIVEDPFPPRTECRRWTVDHVGRQVGEFRGKPPADLFSIRLAATTTG